MISDLRDKVAVITGGASGIGKATATRCLEEGMRVVIADCSRESIDAAVEDLDAGERLHGVLCDVSTLDANAALAEEAEEQFGAVHLAYFNAATLGDVGGWRASEISVEAWRHTLDASLDGPFFGVRAFLPILEKQDEAHILFTASAFALLPGLADPVAYYVAKAGVLSLAECLYFDLTDRGSHIGVTCVLPGNTQTGPYWTLRQLIEATEDDPASWDAEFGIDRDYAVELVDHFTRNGTGPEVIVADVFDAIRSNRFYVTPNVGGHWKYIEARWEHIRAGRNPSLGDKGMDVYKAL